MRLSPFLMSILFAAFACAKSNQINPENDFIHVGEAVHAVETIKVIATLEFYEPDYAHADYEDQGISYDVSIFEIVEPAKHRGRQFYVLHDPSAKRAEVWIEVGRTYLMLIDKDIVESEGVFPGPELMTIVREIE